MRKVSPSYMALSGTQRVSPSATHREVTGHNPAKLIAFYLPQFHRIPENSSWWGPGFTEWTNVARAKPNFDGHYQPHIPRELGFYDLSHVETMREQVELASLAGIHGFCFYHYWFSGRRILEKPVENFVASDIQFPFCLCWANENWTRTWDGNEKDILLEQKYAPGDEERFIDSIAPILRDDRYIKVDGKPLLVVYRVQALPDPRGSLEKWRRAALSHGFQGLHIAVVDFYDVSNPDACGADALVEFPPHKFNGVENSPVPMVEVTNPSFSGRVVDYRKIIAQSAHRGPPSYTLYRGVMPGWDNTPRRQHTSMITVESSPKRYGAWLSYLRAWTALTRPHAADPFIFINAWNEWGEGCHLEPDVQYGLEYIEETARSSWSEIATQSCSIEEARESLDVALRGEEVDVSRFAGVVNYRVRASWVSRVATMLRSCPPLHRFLRAVYGRVRAVGR